MNSKLLTFINHFSIKSEFTCCLLETLSKPSSGAPPPAKEVFDRRNLAPLVVFWSSTRHREISKNFFLFIKLSSI